MGVAIYIYICHAEKTSPESNLTRFWCQIINLLFFVMKRILKEWNLVGK